MLNSKQHGEDNTKTLKEEPEREFHRPGHQMELGRRPAGHPSDNCTKVGRPGASKGSPAGKHRRCKTEQQAREWRRMPDYRTRLPIVPAEAGLPQYHCVPRGCCCCSRATIRFWPRSGFRQGLAYIMQYPHVGRVRYLGRYLGI